MVERLATLDTLSQVQNPHVTLCEIPEYTGELSASLQAGQTESIDIWTGDLDGDWQDIALNMCSLYHGRYKIQILADGLDFVADVTVPDYLETIVIPFVTVKSATIRIIKPIDDVLIFNDLRVVTDQLPQDLLESFTHISLPSFPLGEITVSAGDRKVVLPDITHVQKGAVLVFGNERHRVKGLLGNQATFDDTEDGQQIVETFTGQISIECPIRIGYEDQDIELPSLVLWFSSPTPDLRIARDRYELPVVCNGVSEFYTKRRTQYQEWTLRLEVVGGSPEMVQSVTAPIRLFLEENHVFVNGKRFTFEWQESVVDQEPSTYLDIKPTSAFNIQISLQEEFPWQTVVKGSGRLRNVLMSQNPKK